MSSPRTNLILAVNGNPISADDARALIHRFDRMDTALRDIALLRKHWEEAEPGTWDAVSDLWQAIRIADEALGVR